MTTVAKIISNYEKGCGDWIVVYVDGVLWEGHSLPSNPFTFVDVTKELSQADSFKFIHLTDDEIVDWRNYL